MSVRGEAGRSGLASAVFNLIVVGVVLGRMLGVMGSCRWGVLVIIILDTLACQRDVRASEPDCRYRYVGEG